MIRPLLTPLLALLGTAAAAALQVTAAAPAPAPRVQVAPAPPTTQSPAAPPKPATVATAGPAVAAPPRPSVAARPGLWKVTDADTTIWLFGTIHALPAGFAWASPAIESAIADSDALVIETVLDKDPTKSAALFYSLAMKPGLPPLLDRVRPADRPKIVRATTRSVVPLKVLDGMETWACALILTGASMADLGISAAAGVETTIQASFTAAHKPITGFETPAQQFGYLATLPEEEQRRFLVSTLDEPGEARAEYAAMLTSWSAGDEAAIARTFDAEANISPYLRDVLVTKRNAAWVDTIAARMGQPGHVLIAVGAGHLAGPGSVQALLKARGFAVTRVQ